MLEYGILSPLYRILKDLWEGFRKNRRSLSPTDAIQLRQKWKSEFEKRIRERRKAGLRRDVIVKDVKRVDTYPELEEHKKGISPWFRVSLIDTYHRGILLGLGWGTLTKENGTSAWRYTNHKVGESGEIKVILTGYVPYENIEAVDWNGDEYYGFPHLYCHFTAKSKEPYEQKVFCLQKYVDDIPYYTEVADYDAVHKRSRKAGIDYFASQEMLFDPILTYSTLLSTGFSCRVSPLAGEALLFRQKAPKPFPPRSATFNRVDTGNGGRRNSPGSDKVRPLI